MASSWGPALTDPSIYHKLPTPKSIRLLTILPGRFGDTVQCKLNVFELENAPPYEALSYVWGAVISPTKIICDGQSVSIGPNLGAALQRLKYSNGVGSASRRQRRIWIDALCINQADLDERSQQVSFMKDIFDRAENVVVWLGEDNGYAVKAISLVQRVAQIARQECDHTNLRPTRLSYELIEPRDDLPQPDHLDWHSVELLYENTWFRRVWVVQEVARENASMIIGPHKIAWFDVALCSEWMNNRGYATTLKRARELHPPGSIFDMRKGGSLPTMLLVTSHMEATDPRDKIFALLGLYSAWVTHDGSPPPSLKPDYKKTVMEVYANVVRYLISQPRKLGYGEGSLSIMLRNESYDIVNNYAVEPSSDGDADFPSWVPRWDTCHPTWVGLANRDCASLWSPGLDSAITIKDNDNLASLVLRGFKITTISTLEREFEIPTVRLTSDNTLVKETLAKVKLTTSKYIGTDALKEALASTLTAYASKVRGKAVPFHSEDLENYLTYEDHRKEGFHFADAISIGSSFFTTQSGHMGVGSRRMQIGDEICVFFGGGVLFLVRPVADSYTLVGECYVHGLMHGEAMEQWKAGELKDQWFDLR